MGKFVDSQGLYIAPRVPNSVQWSEEGLLAVAAGNAITLLHPGRLDGPRAFAGVTSPMDTAALDAAGIPEDHSDVHLQLANLRKLAFTRSYHLVIADQGTRSLAWSPLGATPHGGCQLAVVTQDHKVLVYGPPSGLRSEWGVVANLSDQLLSHLTHTRWEGIAPPAGAGASADEDAGRSGAAAPGEGGCDAPLRLRGGGRTKAPAQKRKRQADEPVPQETPSDGGAGAAAAEAVKVGQVVEVCNDEDGLRGCWFPGVVRQVHHGHALVAYDELSASEDGEGRLQEWFGVPGVERQPLGELAGGFQVCDGPGYVLRPSPPQEVAQAGQARQAGEPVECLVNGGWWEDSRVVEVVKGGTEVVCLVHGEQHPLPLANVRNRLAFAGDVWSVREQDETTPPPPKVARKGRLSSGAPGQKAAGKQRNGQQQQQKKKKNKEAAATADQAPGTGEAGPGPPADGAAATPCAATAAAEAGAGSCGGDEGAPSTAAAAKPTTSKKKAAGAGGGSTARKKGGKAAAAAAAIAAAAESPGLGAGAPGAAGSSKVGEAEGYQVPEGLSPADLPTVSLGGGPGSAKASLLHAAARRFLLLRQELPQDECPSYDEPNQHLKAGDTALLDRVLAEFTAVFGQQQLAGCKLGGKAFNTELRRTLRMVWDRCRNEVKRGFQLAPLPAEQQAADTAHPAGAGATPAPSAATGGTAGTVSPATAAAAGAAADGSGPALEPYEVPEGGVKPEELPPVDAEPAAKARPSLLAAAVQRFLELRSQYPPEELPRYSRKSEHLRDRDVWLVERVTAEFFSAYSQLLGTLGDDRRKFQITWTSKLRSKWDRVTNSVVEDKAPATEGKRQAGGKGGSSAAGPSSARRGVKVKPIGTHDEEGQDGEAGPGGRSSTAVKTLVLMDPSSTLPSPAYQMRLFAPAALCMAWSPRCQAGSAGQQLWSLLAVGSKSGHVWLWRHTPSQPGLPRSSQPFGLVGCLRGLLSWVTALSWVRLPGPQGGCLCLAVGTADGGVSLWGASVASLAALAPLPGAGPSGEAGRGQGPLSPAQRPQQGQQQQQQQEEGQQDLARGEGGAGVEAQQAKEQQRAEQAPWLGQYSALERWGVLCAPDLHAVTTLAACLAPLGGGAFCIMVAAGKASGAVAVWQSGNLQSPQGPLTQAEAGAADNGAAGIAAAAAAHYKAAVQAGCRARGAFTTASLHVPHCITGLAWAPVPAPPLESSLAPPPAAAQQAVANGHTPLGTSTPAAAPLPLLCSCSRDGSIRCWQPTVQPAGPAGPACTPSGSGAPLGGGDGAAEVLTLRELPQPQPCARRKKSEAGHGVYGLASSPNGLFVASVSPAKKPSTEFIKQVMTYQKLVQGYVHIDRLWGTGAALPAGTTAAACATRLADQAAACTGPVRPSEGGWLKAPGSLSASTAASAAAGSSGTLWDLAQLLALPRWHEPQQGSAGTAVPAGASGPGAAAAAAAAAAGMSSSRPPSALGSTALAMPAAAAMPSGLASHVVAELEAPFLSLLAGAAGGASVLCTAPEPSWAALRLATALRHVLRPGTAPAPADVRAPAAASAPQQHQQQPRQPEQDLQQQPPSQQQQGQGQPGAALEAVGEAAQAGPGDEWREARERNEMHLLQRHIRGCLTDFLSMHSAAAAADEAAQEAPVEVEAQKQAGAGEGPGRTSALLMADWVIANVQHPHLHPEMMELAARQAKHAEREPLGGALVYFEVGEDLPEPDGLPARETSVLLAGRRVALTGSGVEAATLASVGVDEGDRVSIPRTPATLLLVEATPPWSCRACGRRYHAPATAPPSLGSPTGSHQQQQRQQHEGERGTEAEAAANSDACRSAGHVNGAVLPAWPLCVLCGVAAGPMVPAVQLAPPVAL
ncbi:hypothetical protein N2152v2_003794 [Parachlorella kessleri]